MRTQTVYFCCFFFMFVIRETLIYISENIDITKVLITLGLVPFSVNHWGKFFFKKLEKYRKKYVSPGAWSSVSGFNQVCFVFAFNWAFLLYNLPNYDIYNLTTCVILST